MAGPLPRCICIQCALEAHAFGVQYTPTDETPEEHAARCHPDPVATAARRAELIAQIEKDTGHAKGL